MEFVEAATYIISTVCMPFSLRPPGWPATGAIASAGHG